MGDCASVTKKQRKKESENPEERTKSAIKAI